MRIDLVPVGDDPPNSINVIIEVPVGGEPIKYEMNKAAGTLFVDRFLHTSMRYPGNYGFVPHTLSATTLRDLAPGQAVNLEVDVLAKYVERLLAPR